MNIDRRSLITGLISFVAAPAIVRVESLMKIKVIDDYEDICVKYLDILYGKLYIKPEWCITSFENDQIVIKNIDPRDIYID